MQAGRRLCKGRADDAASLGPVPSSPVQMSSRELTCQLASCWTGLADGAAATLLGDLLCHGLTGRGFGPAGGFTSLHTSSEWPGPSS